MEMWSGIRRLLEETDACSKLASCKMQMCATAGNRDTCVVLLYNARCAKGDNARGLLELSKTSKKI